MSPDQFSKMKKQLDFRDALRKMLYHLARKQMRFNGVIFITFFTLVAFFLQTMCHEIESKITSSVNSDCFCMLQY